MEKNKSCNNCAGNITGDKCPECYIEQKTFEPSEWKAKNSSRNWVEYMVDIWGIEDTKTYCFLKLWEQENQLARTKE